MLRFGSLLRHISKLAFVPPTVSPTPTTRLGRGVDCDLESEPDLAVRGLVTAEALLDRLFRGVAALDDRRSRATNNFLPKFHEFHKSASFMKKLEW